MGLTTQRWNRRQLLGARVVWLVDVVWSGTTVRLSTEFAEVSSTDLGSLIYEPAVESVSLSQGIRFFDDNLDEDQVDIEAASLPFDVAERAAQGRGLEGASAEVSQWIEGTTYETRLVRLRGIVEGVQYGEPGEPVRFQIKGAAQEDVGSYPPADARVCADTWPDAPDPSADRIYPSIVGTPGVIGSGSTNGSPAFAVTVDGGGDVVLVLVAGHEVAASSVQLWNMTAVPPVGFTFAVEHVSDDLGRRVAVVDISAQSASFCDPGSSYFARWTSGGGMWNATRTTDLHGAGEVLTFMLQQSTLIVDAGRLAVAAQLLRWCRIDVYIDTVVKPWDWIRDQLLSILPVGLASGPDGIYPIVWRDEVNAARDAVFHWDLDADPTIERVEDLAQEDSDPVNRVTIDYGLRADTGTQNAHLVLTGSERTEDSHLSTLPADLSQRARARPGGKRRHLDVNLQPDVVYEPVSAGMIAYKQIAARALPTTPLSVLAPSPLWEWLEPGDIGVVTHAATHLTARVFVIEHVERSDDGRIGFRLRAWQNPARDLWRAA